MLRVAFVNENTLGHRSYLKPLALGINSICETDWFDAIPLPLDLNWFGNVSVPGIRRWGLDAGATRWRIAASCNALRQVKAENAKAPYSAIIVNTQSVALSFSRWRSCPPLLVCLDATFQQLAKTPWFAPGVIGRLAAPLMLAWLLKREVQLFQRAKYLLPWSEAAARSLRDDYGIESNKIRIVPPTVNIQHSHSKIMKNEQKRQILFMGGDFKRKGGQVLLEAFRRHLKKDWDLNIVTQSDVQEESGVRVYRGITHGSAAWLEQWQNADVFVFPSALETFGIVLLEAIAFGVPVISSQAGAANEILNKGKAGILLNDISVESIVSAIHLINEQPHTTVQRVENGLAHASKQYNKLENNKVLLALINNAANQSTAIK
jgi:glycosyltransferase involved in cell wall biosynthesis